PRCRSPPLRTAESPAARALPGLAACDVTRPGPCRRCRLRFDSSRWAPDSSDGAAGSLATRRRALLDGALVTVVDARIVGVGRWWLRAADATGGRRGVIAWRDRQRDRGGRDLVEQQHVAGGVQVVRAAHGAGGCQYEVDGSRIVGAEDRARAHRDIAG